MARIPDFLLDSVIYLYPSHQDAQAGEQVGGTGFLISEPATTQGAPRAVYAVTNSHVIREGRSPVVRLNNKQGGIDVLELDGDQWLHHPDGDDIAICPIHLSEAHRYFAIERTHWFMTEDELATLNVGPGDDVFFVGRYINHEGRQENSPTVRLGIISMLPSEKILHPRGTLVDSFLVEARSLSGYSGSPVFLNRQPGSPYRMEWDEDAPEPGQALRSAPGRRGVIGFIGIDWGHDADYRPVLEPDRVTRVPGRWVVEQNSGIMHVAPAWKLAEFLQDEDLVNMRREQEQEWVDQQANHSDSAGTAPGEAPE
ncbi:trypsin-like peptidase domain-containing protein [Kribbella sp. NPDC004536]|uniref:trypsin-like peptidase domain-containing protein n=1 Tax=Kribbella sp. NPDC004536 TaxID=3364106 RepID=UPI0036B468A5